MVLLPRPSSPRRVQTVLTVVTSNFMCGAARPPLLQSPSSKLRLRSRLAPAVALLSGDWELLSERAPSEAFAHRGSLSGHQ